MSQTEFVKSDNAKRSDRYQKSQSIEDSILAMNDLLAAAEKYEPSGVERPSLYVFGLPRSGTSLMSQVLIKHIDIGYINNLIARFWKAPLTGIQLSKSLLGDQPDILFESDYGKTQGVEGPHEFAYFWHHWLKMTSAEDFMSYNQFRADIDWDALGNVIRSMQDVFDKPIMFRAMFAANHIQAFAKFFPMPLFIYIERDEEDVALSILQARKAYYHDASEWWATYPPQYNEIKDLPFPEQIARQVIYLHKTYKECLSLIDPSLYVRISYKDFCANPMGFLERIQDSLKSNYSYDLRLRENTPEAFSARSKGGANDEDEVAVIDALRKIKRDGG